MGEFEHDRHRFMQGVGVADLERRPPERPDQKHRLQAALVLVAHEAAHPTECARPDQVLHEHVMERPRAQEQEGLGRIGSCQPTNHRPQVSGRGRRARV